MEKSRDEGGFVRGRSNPAALEERSARVTADGFERLVRRYRSEIFRTVLRRSRSREDAEDLTQITFLNAYTALQRGADPDAPRAWLHAIARNAGTRRFHQNHLTEVELDADAPPAADEDVSVHELQTALARLTFNQRASLLMREVGGLSASEIGARLGISPGAVATLLFRARKALRAELDGEADSRFGRIGLVSAGLIRQAWIRLVPVLDGGQALSRSPAMAAGVVAAVTGVTVLTGSTPSAARVVQTQAPSAAPRVAVAVLTASPARAARPDNETGPVRTLRRAPVARPVHVAAPAAVIAPVARPARVSRPVVAVESSRPAAAPRSAPVATESPSPPAAAAAPASAPAPAPDADVVATVSERLPQPDAVAAAVPAVPPPDISQAAPVDVTAVTSAASATSEILPPPPPAPPPAVATILPGG